MRRRKFLTITTTSLLGLKSIENQIINTFEIIRKKRFNTIKTDVLIVGGGPAGIGAAVGAAKMGINTLLIENYGFFGGVASWGVGMCLNQMRPNGNPRGFVHELLLTKLQNYGEQAVRVSTHQFFVNVEYLKVAILDVLEDVGCNYLVHAKAVDALTSGNRIRGVLISTKSGLIEIKANVIVDCTGDADVAYYAGAATLIEKGNLSPQTLLFNVGNINNYAQSDTEKVYSKAKSRYTLLPGGQGSYILMKVSNCHHFYVNHSGTRDFGNFDITDPIQYTKAECLSRRQIIQMVEAMREFGDNDMKNCEIIGASTQIGIRESGRIKGEYILTESDAINGSRFDDAIAWRSGWLDIGFVKTAAMKIHQVPYRSIVPSDIDGLLAAGRCISTDHSGLSAGKSMGNCIATGHAAGVAAALAFKLKKIPRTLDVRKIQEVLRNDGVDLSRGGEEQDSRMAI